VALGLALSPAFGAEGIAHAQSGYNPSSNIPAVRDGTGMAQAVQGGDVESCRQLVREGRAALQAGDKVKAEKLARQAAAMHVSLPYWEADSPEKLLMEIGVKTTPPPAQAMKADPHLLVKQGRDALKAGKVEDAQKLCLQAKAVPNVKWGLFEDTPDKVLDDVQKARATRDKTEAARLTAEGRRLYEQGKYDEAEKLAVKASALRVNYGVWDFSDKPEKLLADVQTAKEKARKTKVPAPTGTAVATNKPTSPTGSMSNSAIKQASAPAPSWPNEIRTADAKTPDMKPAVTTAAGTSMPGMPGSVMPVGGPTLPDPVPAQMPTAVTMPPAPTAPGAFNPAKMQAMQCISEGKAHQSAGRWLEARAKYQEAAKCGAEFGPADESPDRCMMDLATQVMKQIDAAMKEVGPSADAKLHQARALAVGFALDTHGIDVRLTGLHSTMPPAPTGPAAANDAAAVGRDILNKARMEIQRGQCESARRLATEVHNGPYGLQADAIALLRTIDVEEHNQRVLAANRNFDAGEAAYRGKDYRQATAIFTQVDATLLSPDKKERLRTIMVECARAESVAQAPAAGIVPPPSSGNPVMTVSAPLSPPGAVTTAASPGLTGLQGQKPMMTAPAEGDSLAAQVHAMQEIEYQRLRAEGLEVQSSALQMWERGETDAALTSLETYIKKVKASKLDPASVARLQKPIDAKISSFRLMKPQKDDVTRIAHSKENFVKEKANEFQAEQKKEQQVKDLMKQYNALYKEGKYREAELAAAKAHELDPDDATIEGAIQVAQFHGNLTNYDKIRERKEKLFVESMDEAEDPGPAVNMQRPLSVDPVRLQIARGRGERDRNGINVLRSDSPREREIQAKLEKPVQVNFHNVSLRQAMDDLREMTKMNIHIESQALATEGVNPETPISLKGDLKLKSALNVILDQCHLTYIVRDEMLKITTPRGAQGNQVTRVFSVADLIIPIDDYITPPSMNVAQTMERIVKQQQMNMPGGGSPLTNNRNMLQNGEPAGTGTGTSSMSTTGGQPSMSTGTIQPGSVGSVMGYNGTVAPTKQTMQDMLIKLITNTVKPQTWAEVGGSGTIDYMPIGMALVINQTPDVQEQVADLLEALRRLQDLQVAVEIRIITLAETFFERIGLDFSLNVLPNKNTQKYEPELVTGNYAPTGNINAFRPSNFLAGVRPGGIIGPSGGNTGSLTSDLSIPIRQSSFQYAIPPFAFPNNPGFDGGLSMGLAFLSDIQVYMFMEAAQGDQRTNVMSAPKLTLFNGQTSTINVNDQQFFVTNVNVVGFGGQIVFVPVNNPVPLGVSLAIQAVISADRRFVRLNLSPTLSNLASATVPLFPVTTFITPVFEGGAQGQPIPFTQFIQQPNVATVQIQTTVSIPDGGTVILGGLKTLSEGRNEFGPPVLSKLPYVNRLFKNVGYGREAESLLLMVTPRIIINSEEEERQAGVVSTPALQP
jgi:type II secretory pathway component GspD/PulD (secretin)/tetratricopeptide (TPR) repeat protein